MTITKTICRTAIIGIATCLLSAISFADSPMPPPADYLEYSPAKTCLAIASAELGKISVFDISKINNERVDLNFSALGWSPNVYVADKCDAIISVYGGLNLLLLTDKRKDVIVFTIHNKTGGREDILLGDLYHNLDVLERTVSHWNWYGEVIWDGETLLVKTLDGREVKISTSKKN